MPPARREDGDPAAATDDRHSNVSCSYCVGISVYTKAMWRQRQSPECRGIQVDFSTSRDRLQDMRERAAYARRDEFTFLGIGVSVYAPEWMEEGKHLPYVKGLGVIAIHTDTDELMKQMEERKRIKRELQQKTSQSGDLQDGDNGGDDRGDEGTQDEEKDDVFDLDEGTAADQGHALVESKVVRGLKTPRGPAVVPASITMAEIRDRTVEKAKYSMNAVYKFWERRLDGFSDRYVDSCRRLTERMEIQAMNTPHSVMWLVHRIEDYMFGKDDGEK